MRTLMKSENPRIRESEKKQDAREAVSWWSDARRLRLADADEKLRIEIAAARRSESLRDCYDRLRRCYELLRSCLGVPGMTYNYRVKVPNAGSEISIS
ncbi:hypothetical protein DU53_07260 [Kosmotoga sp. DU53]|nr:hypothetical protein DU53_07260 [Kosmotoga sp. DU53]